VVSVAGGTVAVVKATNGSPGTNETTDTIGTTGTNGTTGTSGASGAIATPGTTLPRAVDAQTLSCGAPVACVALPADPSPSEVAPMLVYTTSDGGTTWSTVSTHLEFVGYALSCPSASTCIALGATTGNESIAIATSDGGASWSLRGSVAASVPNIVWGYLDCLSTEHCVAVGSNLDGAQSGLARFVAATTTDGGSTWSVTSLPSLVVVVDGLSCPSTTRCLALGGVVTSGGSTVAVTSSDGGASWAVGNTVALHPLLAPLQNDMSCASTAGCVIVGYDTNGGTGGTFEQSVAAATSRDGGATWKAATMPSFPNFASLGAVACPTTSECVAVGSYVDGAVDVGIVVSSTNGGATWSAAALPAGTLELQTVGCPTANHCVAAGESGALVSNDGGRTWTP
jgi:photosystem II stability/assembly factor-like uncharacterized protein